MANRKYETPDDLRAAVEAYFKKTESRGEFPDYAGMKLFIGIRSEETIKKYCEIDGFKDVFDDAKLRRESFLVRRMTNNNKLAQGCMNALKQEINGGYSDKPADNGDRKLVIELKGIGENAYK